MIQLIMSNNPYEILHLQEDATYDEIKERYRHLTRSLHPDKQPLENYQMTKKLFEQIDEAYKSISSPLRRHLFREYGIAALKVLEEVPGCFQEFDREELSPEQINLMVYLLYEREASFQTDKTKFVTKMVVNVSKTLKGRPKNAKKHSKRNYYLPEIENCTFDYEMVLPELFGFANTFAVSQTTANIRNDPKATMSFSVSMARRMYWNYMLLLQGSISSDESNVALGITRVCENNLTLTFTPLSFTNWTINAPKISVEKSLQDYQISGTIEATGGISIDYSDSSQKRIGKSLKLFMEQGSIGMIPRVEVQVSDNFRLFAQISAAVESQGKEGINLRPSLTYGYRLALSEDLKVELASCIGSPNYLQLSFMSSKFRVGIPLIASEVDLVQFQLVKVATMVLALAAVEGFKAKRRSDTRARHRLFKENQTRLNELKRQINRRLSDADLSAQLKREMETKYNGLVIIRAFFGAEDKIGKIAKKLKIIKLDDGVTLERNLSDIEETVIGLNLPVEDIHDEAEDVTSLLQSEVLGGQLLNYNLEQLKKYSPVIEPSATPSIFILYVQRGQLKTYNGKCQNTINLGTKRVAASTKIRKFLHNLISCLV